MFPNLTCDDGGESPPSSSSSRGHGRVPLSGVGSVVLNRDDVTEDVPLDCSSDSGSSSVPLLVGLMLLLVGRSVRTRGDEGGSTGSDDRVAVGFVGGRGIGRGRVSGLVLRSNGVGGRRSDGRRKGLLLVVLSSRGRGVDRVGGGVGVEAGKGGELSSHRGGLSETDSGSFVP